MLISQLSVFLENKKGRFTEVAELLGDAGINMTAFTVAENSDFGILRLIVSDAGKARELLKAKGYAVTTTDIVCIECANEPGALALIMRRLTEADIFIEYMYAFSVGTKATVVIRPTEVERAEMVLQASSLS